ncbi:MAG: hypothetical protein GTO51_06340 [Candidatus Latescibacteria bacterium]|nr:hypothetical protein [Candidatus Latescibacterota bacterium]NIM21410.1 hypothetical protein [Candidatus Latescibacterota bacterium]NIM65591.1 hypothetical protein [Candidatus Latescibacterota bacterium]NIO01971.1 hypothetical protein [Candidatus Latescibacterota bacterium]NIO77614.1 hypothetical protein [Candidatus Latescibacterota bacterium]
MHTLSLSITPSAPTVYDFPQKKNEEAPSYSLVRETVQYCSLDRKQPSYIYIYGFLTVKIFLESNQPGFNLDEYTGTDIGAHLSSDFSILCMIAIAIKYHLGGIPVVEYCHPDIC